MSRYIHCTIESLFNVYKVACMDAAITSMLIGALTTKNSFYDAPDVTLMLRDIYDIKVIRFAL